LGFLVISRNSAANPGSGSRFRSTNSRLGISKFAVCQAQEFGCRPLIRLHAGIELVDRALDLNPSFARGWQQSAWLRMLAGEPDPANMPHQLCLASLTVSSADGYAPSCASRKSAPALDDAKPTINAGPMSSSRLTGSSPFARPMSKRDTPDEETNDSMKR